MPVITHPAEWPGAAKAALTHKVGPLPVWGWGAVGAGAILAYRMLRTRGSSSSLNVNPAPVASIIPGSLGGSSGGGGGGGGALVGSLPSIGGGSSVGGGSGIGAGALPDTSGSQDVTTSGNTFGGSNPGGVLTPIAPGGSGGPVSTYNLPNPNQDKGAGYVFGGTTKGVGATVPVDLTGPSQDTNTYVQQLFAIESGAPIPAGSLWPSEATNSAWRRQTLIQFVSSLVGSGSYYNPNGTYLSANQVLAAKGWNDQSPALNLNPVYQSALDRAAQVASGYKGQLLPWESGGAPLSVIPTGSYGDTPVSGYYGTGSGSVPVGSGGASVAAGNAPAAPLTLTEFSNKNRAGVIARAEAAGKNPTTKTVNQTVQADYAKYLQSLPN